MHKKEKWVKWNPLKHFAELKGIPLYIEAIEEFKDQFKCVMHNKQKDRKIEFDFGSHVIAYQYIYEGYRLNTLGWGLDQDELEANQEESNATRSLAHDFFISEGSVFLDSVKKDLAEIENDRLVHYVLFDSDFCLDIVATQAPEVCFRAQLEEING